MTTIFCASCWQPSARTRTPRSPWAGMHTARFLTTAAQLHHPPPSMCRKSPSWAAPPPANPPASTFPTQQSNWPLPRKPGRTQHINPFALGKQGVTDALGRSVRLLRLRGGVASDKLRWQQVMVNHLVSRPRPHRHQSCCAIRVWAWTELDEALLEAVPLRGRGPEILIAGPKPTSSTCSGASQGAVHYATASWRRRGEDASALKKQGWTEVAQLLW